ncbi:GNAT family N-acetyltransferase [uncultured Ruegeria sp.]|uniref:GNAT family N-acetyltransferase n=1 Tax=uncultured Ruegeria sp. TaxID=259304 RepID=UPI00261AEC65|nr:GNAT family N-acetyltransferase [uncultured Ruegeria sp.]
MEQTRKFETARLRVQSWSEKVSNGEQRRQLIDELKDVLTPAVLQHLPEPLQIHDTGSSIKDWINERAAESEVLTIRDRADDSILGLLILAEFLEPETLKTVHLGYLFCERAWGKGHATELISSLITSHRADGQSVQLYGGVESGNPASARVLKKNGFELEEGLLNSTTEMFGLFISCNFDKLYRSTRNALGEPTQVFVGFFKQYSGKPLRVLDIGCGQGRDALFITRLGHSVVGVDISPNGIRDLLEAARHENLSVEGIVEDIRTFVPEDKFDVLLIDRTLHMLLGKDRLEVLNRLISSVSDEGWVLFSDEPSNMQGFKDLFTSSNDAWEVEMDKPETLFVRRSSRKANS